MRTQIIPSQITTVEDTIAGSITMTQLCLLMIPVFGGTILYILFPTPMSMSWYKAIITIVLFITSGLLAVKVQEKIILQWVILITSFHLRPRYYVFNKNDSSYRQMDMVVFDKPAANTSKTFSLIQDIHSFVHTITKTVRKIYRRKQVTVKSRRQDYEKGVAFCVDFQQV